MRGALAERQQQPTEGGQVCFRSRVLLEGCLSAVLTAGIVCVLASVSLRAAELELDGRVEAGATYTDNVFLTETGRRDDLVLNVSPGLTLRARSRRLEAAVDYGVDYLVFTSTGGDDLRHNVAGIVDYEAVEDFLFLSGRASLRQVFLDREQGFSASRANRTGNRRTVQTYTGQARMIGRLKSLADWSVTYRYGQTLSPADDPDDPTLTVNFSDNQTHEYEAALDSGPRFGRLSWRLFGEGRRVIRDGNTRNFEEDRLGGEVSYQFNHWFALIAGAGVSENNLRGGIVSEDGFNWYGGLRLTPSDRTRFEVRGGRDGDRQSWRAQLEHKLARRVTLRAGYRDEISSLSLVENEFLQGNRLSPEGGVVTGGGVPVFDDDALFSLSDADFRRQSLDFGLTWRAKRSSAGINGVWERRTFTGEVGTSRSFSVNANYLRNLDRRTDLFIQASYRQNEFENSSRSDDTILNSIELRHRIFKNLEGVLNYRYSQRFSNVPGGDLHENAVSFFLRATF